jgi:hypothetical protein
VGANFPTRIILAVRSGRMCAFPKCGKHLTYEAKVRDDTYIGKAVHIRGEKPIAARYDATMSHEERDSVRNLIYLCGTITRSSTKLRLIGLSPRFRLSRNRMGANSVVRSFGPAL